MKFNRTNWLILALTSILTVASATHAADNTVKENTIKTGGVIERGNAKRANELLNRAVDYLKKNGTEKSFAAFNNRKGSFVNNEYYVFVVNMDGTLKASGGEPDWQIGLNVRDLHDAAGKNFVSDMLTLAKTQETGTVEYHWLNRFDNHIENKTSQFHKIGDNLVCVGYYIPRASEEEATAMLNKAVAFLKKSGSAAAFKAFNNPQGGFVAHDEYVFAIGLADGKYRASGAAPKLTGVDVRDMTDAAGKPFFKEMITLAKTKGTGTVDYVWRNPATNGIEQKHSHITRVGDVLLGVGYYTKN